MSPFEMRKELGRALIALAQSSKAEGNDMLKRFTVETMKDDSCMESVQMAGTISAVMFCASEMFAKAAESLLKEDE